ncbi:hypothetical protein KVA01_23050 [Kocuria varians]|uniref:M23ase beta-sheet core domain-containing protein n=1 Tax=Kocuria varians TaxID=1272 RepID=A0A4Y4DBL6_KOCVA|nr:M23 family metallopeptidase [Kocuria varians]GED00151.1 hypothetical protein KVA01_23050 [Kocuria varians]
MALTAFTSFSVLVAVSVALSNGTATAPWQPAMAHDAQGPHQAVPAGQTQGDDAAQPARASLFASVADPAEISKAQAVPASLSVAGSSAPNATGGIGTLGTLGTASGGSGAGQGKSSGKLASCATSAFDGKHAVHTLIAPAHPVIVLKGGEFGWRTAPDTGQHELHNGSDIAAPEGSPAVAALDGTVTAVFWDVWGGNRVEVSHANGMKTTYNHLSKVMVRVGDSLKASEQLGEVGQTGLRVTGPHLHFETWVDGKVVDAQSFDWETCAGIIKASRAPYTTQDENSVQPKTDPNAKPGTDLGPMPDPAGLSSAERERLAALARKDGKGTTTPGTGHSGGNPGGKGGSGGNSQGKDNSKGTLTAGGQQTPPPSTGTGDKKQDKQDKQTPRPVPSTTTTQPTKSQPSGTPGSTPKPTQPATGKPSGTPGSTTLPTQPPAPVDPRTAPVTSLTTLVQLQQRTQATVGAHLALRSDQQVKAYAVGSPLDQELQALLLQGKALGVPVSDPYRKKLAAASNAVTAASPVAGSAKPVDPALTKAATDALGALQTEALKAPAYQPAAVAGPGAGTNPGVAVPGEAAPAAPAGPGAGAPAAPAK